MAQPKWKLLTGADYFSIFVDETGVYPPEMVIGQEYEDDKRVKFEVYRFPLERFKIVKKGSKGYLVPEDYRPDWQHPLHQYEAWFVKDLDAIARTVGRTKAEIVHDFTSDDPMALRRAYEDVGSHWGFNNFDHYPEHMNEKQFSLALRGR
jgi:hypothetical protein